LQCLPRNLERLTLVTTDFGWDFLTNRRWAGEGRALNEVRLWLVEARPGTPRPPRWLDLIVRNYAYEEVPDGVQAERDEVELRAKEAGVVLDIYSEEYPPVEA
jgi:hypothetical protein